MFKCMRDQIGTVYRTDNSANAMVEVKDEWGRRVGKPVVLNKSRDYYYRQESRIIFGVTSEGGRVNFSTDYACDVHRRKKGEGRIDIVLCNQDPFEDVLAVGVWDDKKRFADQLLKEKDELFQGYSGGNFTTKGYLGLDWIHLKSLKEGVLPEDFFGVGEEIITRGKFECVDKYDVGDGISLLRSVWTPGNGLFRPQLEERINELLDGLS